MGYKVKQAVVAITIALFGVMRTTPACEIPVFRYALECWQPSAYEGVVFHKGPLDEDTKRLLTWLNTRAANLNLRLVNAEESIPTGVEKIWAAQHPRELPWLVVRYPYPSSQDAQRHGPVTDMGDTWTVASSTVWEGPLTSNHLHRVIHSPARERISRDILSGISCVWVLVESGKPEVDAAKRDFLEGHLKTIKEGVRLPEVSHAWVAEERMAGAVPLKVDFSVISLSRQDSAEEVFLHLLLRSQPGLAQHAEVPVAFPVFGQGRAIWPLVGDQINTGMVDNAIAFLLGFCSCEIKELNPGFDLLMDVDWYGSVTNRLTAPAAPPELVSVASVAEQVDAPAAPAPASESAPVEASRAARFPRGVTTTLIVLALAVLAGGLWIMRRGEQ